MRAGRLVLDLEYQEVLAPSLLYALAAEHRNYSHACVSRGAGVGFTQRLQYPLIKEYTLNYSKIPNMI